MLLLLAETGDSLMARVRHPSLFFPSRRAAFCLGCTKRMHGLGQTFRRSFSVTYARGYSLGAIIPIRSAIELIVRDCPFTTAAWRVAEADGQHFGGTLDLWQMDEVPPSLLVLQSKSE